MNVNFNAEATIVDADGNPIFYAFDIVEAGSLLGVLHFRPIHAGGGMVSRLTSDPPLVAQDCTVAFFDNATPTCGAPFTYLTPVAWFERGAAAVAMDVQTKGLPAY